MAREKSTNRLVKFWWCAAFTAGVVAGAVLLRLTDAQRTAWTVGFLGAIAFAVAIYEQFSEPGLGGSARQRGGWTNRGWAQPAVARKPNKPKAGLKRGQLRLPAHRDASPAPAKDSSPTELTIIWARASPAT
jgi:uncharacterized membrane protein YfcA